MISVVVPVHNGGDGLRRCLEALRAADRPPDEIIVVDDASTDGSAGVAAASGAQVISLAAGPHGPAVARNRGAAWARGDLLVFLDADVAPHPEALRRMEDYLAAEPDVAAVFGSYDDDPPARGLVTRYKNLVHHYVHQHGRREAGTFWAGCGAIRRHIFVEAAGFAECYARPSIEDIELGSRLRRKGHRIRLCPDVQVAHLKHWTLGSWLRTDLFDRAIPWTRLIMRNADLPRDLNLDIRSRLSAFTAWAGVMGLFLGFWWGWAWIAVPVAWTGVGYLNFDLYRFFERHGGVRFAVGAAGLHGCYLLYSSATFVLVAAYEWIRRCVHC